MNPGLADDDRTLASSTSSGLSWLLAGLLASLAVVQTVAMRTGGPSPIWSFLFNPFASIALSGVFFHYLVTTENPKTREAVIQWTPVALLPPLGRLAWGVSAPPLLLMQALFGLGAVGVLGYLRDVASAESPRFRRARLEDFGEALVFPLAAALAPYGLWSTYDLNPVYDVHVFAFEELLGMKFSLLGVESYGLLPFSAVATACYVALPIGLSLAAARCPSPAARVRVLLAMVVAGACGFALYYVCPVVGPLQAFGTVYPAALPDLASIDVAPLHVDVAAPRNGMPSLHAAWALLIWFNTRRLVFKWRLGFAFFAAMTLWAAMGLKDTHWLTDLVVAVPFTVAIQCAVVRGPVSRRLPGVAAFGLGAALTAGWLLGLRNLTMLGPVPPWLAWLAVIVTVALPLVLERLASSPEHVVSTEAVPVPDRAGACLPAQQGDPLG